MISGKAVSLLTSVAAARAGKQFAQRCCALLLGLGVLSSVSAERPTDNVTSCAIPPVELDCQSRFADLLITSQELFSAPPGCGYLIVRC